MTRAEMNAILLKVQPYVQSVAAELSPRDVSFRDDLTQEGLLAASEALASWEPGKAGPVEWLKRPLRLAMLEYIRANRFGASGMVPAEPGERTAKRKGKMPVVESMDAPRAARADLDSGAPAGERTLHDEIGTFEEPPDYLALKHLPACVAALGERERAVLRFRYVEEMTLAEVGKKLGLTRERVRQIEKGALQKMRCLLAGKGAESQ